MAKALHLYPAVVVGIAMYYYQFQHTIKWSDVVVPVSLNYEARNWSWHGNNQDGASRQTTKFEELFSTAYKRSLGKGEGALGNTQRPNKIRRVYNINEFPSEYRTNGGLDDTDRQLLGLIYSNVSSSFEYGLGESTYIAAWTKMPRWSGIDSDSNWVVGVRDKEIVPPHFQFNFGDIGPTKEWGVPLDVSANKNLFRYVVAPLVLEREPFEVYLVDGRWRVACACMSFLHAISTGADMEKVRVMLHDYRDAHRGYNIIEKEIADLERQSNKLAVFKLRPGVEESDIEDLYLRHVNRVGRRR